MIWVLYVPLAFFALILACGVYLALSSHDNDGDFSFGMVFRFAGLVLVAIGGVGAVCVTLYLLFS